MIQEILSTEHWLIEPQYLKPFLDVVASKDIAETMKVAANDEKLFMFLFDEKKTEGKPYEVKDGIATIDIQGPLMKKASGFIARILGIKGMDEIGENFKAALADDDVKGIFLNISSPGGTVDGTAILSDIIYNSRGQKPILAFADSTMTSAAYWIGSAADSVIMSDNTTRIGSVGVVAVHRDISKAADEAGLKFTVFSSGSFKAAGNEFEALSKKAKAYIQDRIDFFKDRFVEAISRNLNVPASSLSKDITEAKIFLGQQGIDAGLAHEILTKDQAFAKLRSVIDGKEKFGESKLKMKGGVKTMPEKEKAKLELRIEGLEADLKAKDVEILTLKSQVETQVGNMTESETALTKLQGTSTELAEKVTGLETKLEEATPFVEIGKKAVVELRAEIKKQSVQLKGDDYNEAFVDKQLEAFDDDYEALLMFRADQEKTMAKVFKKGEINQDEDLSDAEKNKKEYAIGQAIGSGTSLKVVKS